jgi:hypothetical protein
MRYCPLAQEVQNEGDPPHVTHGASQLMHTLLIGRDGSGQSYTHELLYRFN